MQVAQALGLGLSLFGAGTACGSGQPEEPPILPGQEPPSCELSRRVCTIDRVVVPAAGRPALEIGFDLDGNGYFDNALPFAISYYRDELDGFPVRGLEGALERGEVPWLLDLYACASDETDEVRLALRGTDTRPILPSVGTIAVDGAITAELGEGALPLTAAFEWDGFDEAVDWIDTYAMSFALRLEGDTLEGRLGGAFLQERGFPLAVSAIAKNFNRVVAETVGCPEACPIDSVAFDILDLFDEDQDGEISEVELAQSDLVEGIGAPDADLLDQANARGVFWPLHDGIAESYSFAFTVRAACASVE